MKLVATLKNMLILFAVVLLNSLTFVGHSAAMSAMSHDMSGMSHGSSDAISCATLCRTAVVNKEENTINNDENEDDDEPIASFYVESQPLHIGKKSVSQRLYATEVKPPPKIPIYILYAVFRV